MYYNILYMDNENRPKSRTVPSNSLTGSIFENDPRKIKRIQAKKLDMNFFENLLDMECDLKENFSMPLLQNVINSYSVSIPLIMNLIL